MLDDTLPLTRRNGPNGAIRSHRKRITGPLRAIHPTIMSVLRPIRPYWPWPGLPIRASRIGSLPSGSPDCVSSRPTIIQSCSASIWMRAMPGVGSLLAAGRSCLHLCLRAQGDGQGGRYALSLENKHRIQILWVRCFLLYACLYPETGSHFRETCSGRTRYFAYDLIVLFNSYSF